MISHWVGIHDYVEELDFTMEDGIVTRLGLQRYCWICHRPE